MNEFAFLFIFRALSGAKNGSGYAKSEGLALIGMIMLILSALLIIYFNLFLDLTLFQRITASLSVVASALGVWLTWKGLAGNTKIDIHFWELWATGGVTVAWVLAGGNLLTIAASVYPGLIMHKGFVNTLQGHPWWDKATDDPTGATFSIPFLGIKVPRLGTVGRVILAIASIAGLIAVEILGWSINLGPR